VVLYKDTLATMDGAKKGDPRSAKLNSSTIQIGVLEHDVEECCQEYVERLIRTSAPCA